MAENVPGRITDEINKEASGRNLVLDYDDVLKFFAGDTTPTVKNLTRFRCADSVVTITHFDNGQQGQRIFILGDDKTSIVGTATIKRTLPFPLLQVNSIYSFEYIDGIWYENAYPSASARVYNSANQNLIHNTYTAITFDSERFDTNNFHSVASNTSRLTIPVGYAGKYQIGGCVQFDSNAVGVRHLRIRLNGSTYIAAQEHTVVGVGTLHVNVSTLYALADNDYVELIAFQTSMANIDALSSANSASEFWFFLT